MTEEQKQKIIELIQTMLPNVAKERISSVLDLVLLEISSYNSCKIEIDWTLFNSLITEILYQSLKSETEQSVTSIKRGDTSISYATTQQSITALLGNYSDTIKRLIGCDSGVFFY
ncbi:TPA: hypothetical protein RD623_001720 [Enterococcus faecalis]|nr:hypothetical protein [Enterococcus faecalis]HDT7993806.1 hypothetical protein [Enterococcus faecalis]HDT8093480.1 hypothetical protein [Enterococcus faecalis]HDT8208019.1 hypothetical protein [Enterococcus faecalis]HDV0810204.1 hypothetical protein [Enterococcus faecalis]